MKIKIEKIYAVNDEELEQELNKIDGKVISVEPMHDHYYKVIYEMSN